MAELLKIFDRDKSLCLIFWRIVAKILDMSKSGDELLRRWSHIQGTLFPWLREEVGEFTAKHERIVLALDVLELEAHVPGPPGGPGRPPEDRLAIARAFVAKAVLNLPTTTILLDRLQVDARLRRICGWERRAQVPSEATFSRAFAEFAASCLAERAGLSGISCTGHDDGKKGTITCPRARSPYCRMTWSIS